jgi:DNA-binding phage protein
MVMKYEASVSHDEMMVRKLRKNRKFAMEYLNAAIEDTDEPKVLSIALRRIAEANSPSK